MKKIGICLLMICMLLTSCVSYVDPVNGVDVSQTEDGAALYNTKDVKLAHEYVMDETVFQNTLYYLNYERAEDESSAGKYTIYQMDLGQMGAEPTEIPVSIDEMESIADMTVDKDGSLNLLIFKYDGKEENANLTDAIWARVDKEAKVSASYSVIDVFKDEENQYSSGFEIDTEGNLYIGTESGVSVINQEGLIYHADCNGVVRMLCQDSDGKVYALWYGRQGLTMAEVRLEAKSFGPEHNLSWLKVPFGAGAGTEGLLLASENGVYDYDLETKNYTIRFKWTALDMVVDNHGRAIPLDDGRVLWAGKEYIGSDIKATFLMIQPLENVDQMQEKQTLTFGGISGFIEPDVREAIVEFNRSSKDYRIEIREYGADDAVAGMEQLNAEIVSGNAPDIFAIPVQSAMKLYAEKGILEDLYPYMERDEMIAKEELQENILKAYEVDGKLYGIPIFYKIETLAGTKALLGERQNWNLDEMIAFIDGLETESQIFKEASKSGVLKICLWANKDSIITKAGNEVQFNREYYLKILEFSNRFIDDERFTYTEEEIPNLIDEQQVYLMDNSVFDFSFYQLNTALFGEPIVYVGYPSENGSGSLASSTSTLAINGKCIDKESAWQFVSSMLTEEFQENVSFRGFPIRKSGLEKQIERAMEKTYTTDENGNQQENVKGMISMGTLVVDLYAAKEEEVQVIRRMIESVDKTIDFDEQVLDIIMEESQGYFGGRKPIEETADVVENRIQLYINESGR